ncbi:DUF4190 domain-containing protein [Streptomyces sp. NPDC048643]|uniref:DUF4190 domain-containing protein n=1 Tax=Streptomyces sp. NPDC048643 TaxID=3155637 RepID=UPI0034488ECB
MSEDARTPETPRDTDAWTPTAQGNGWTAPAERENATRADDGARWVDGAADDGPQYAVTGESGEGPEQVPPPADRAPADGPRSAESAADRTRADGPGSSVPAQGTGPFAAPGQSPASASAASQSSASASGRAPAPQVSLGKPGADRRQEPNPWAPPEETDASGRSARGSGSATPSPAYGLPTITSLPGTGVPPGPAAPGGPVWDNPFAAPAAHTPYPQPGPGEPVPPPPIAPGGPGQLPYGYGYPQYPGAGPSAYGGVPGYGWPMGPPAPSNGLGTASLVLGIIAAVLFCAWPLAIVLGILAVIFGVIGRGRVRKGEATNPGQALAGIICGSVGIVLGAALIVVIVALPDEVGSDDSDGYDGFSTSLVTQQR